MRSAVTDGGAEDGRVEARPGEGLPGPTSDIDFRTIAEISPGLIMVADHTGIIQYVNPTFCRSTGFDYAEVIGQRIHDLGELEPQTVAELWDKLGSGLPWRGEFAARTKHGKELWIHSSISPITDGSGRVTHFVTVSLDITERKRAEEALRGSEEKFRQLTEALPAMTFIVQGARPRFVSSRAEEILGYTIEELLAMDFWDPVHPGFKEAVRERGFASQQGRSDPEPYEMKFVTKSGEERWGLAAVSPIELDGAPAVVGCVFDITETRKTAEALHERDLQLRLMTEQMPSVVWMTDRNLTVTHVAGAGLSRLGIDVSEYLGMTIPPHYPLDSTETTLFDAHTAALNGASSAYELKFLGIWFESRIEPLNGPDGEIIGCLGLSFDISRRKEAEAALSESELKFGSLVDTMPAAAFIFQGSQYRYANRACYEVLGYEEKDLERLNFWDVIHPDYRDLVRERGLARLRGEDVPATYELRFLKKDGEPRWGLYSGAVIQYEGKPAILGIVSDITERKVAEQALGASEEKFRTLVDTMPAAAFIYQGTQLKYVNRTFFDVLGYTLEDSSNLTWWDVLHPDYRDLVRERGLARLRGEPVPASYEVRFLTKSGESRWGIFAGALITYEGEPAVIGTVYDITERKAAEQAVIDSEEKFRTLVDTMPAAVIIFQDNKIRYANQVAFDVFGHSPEDMTKVNFWEFVHPDYRDLIRERGAARLRGEDVPSSYEMRFTRKDGEQRWGLYLSAAITYEGKPALIGSIYDITERKSAEEALGLSEDRYRLLYEDNPSMYFTLSSDLLILSANHHGADQLGYEAAELVGQPFTLVVHPDDQARTGRQLSSLVRRRSASNDLEFRKVRKDGEVIWVRESARVAQDVDGKDIVLVVCEDISERKRMEEELQSLREEVERKAERAIVSRVSPYNLSWRELTVLDLVTGGRSDKEIAVVLGIRPQTVSKHVANVLKKMTASSRTEAGVRALREGLIK